MVLVDTAIWSLILRRAQGKLSAEQLALRHHLIELIDQGQATIIGLVRQEILSGIRDQAMFERVREYLRPFLDEPITTSDHEEAARLFSLCRTAGIAATSADMLICAVALRRGWQIYSTDADFEHYARIAPLRLHSSS